MSGLNCIVQQQQQGNEHACTSLQVIIVEISRQEGLYVLNKQQAESLLLSLYVLRMAHLGYSSIAVGRKPLQMQLF